MAFHILPGELAPAMLRLGELFSSQDYQSVNAIGLSCVSALFISFASAKASLTFGAVTFLTLNNLVKVFHKPSQLTAF